MPRDQTEVGTRLESSVQSSVQSIASNQEDFLLSYCYSGLVGNSNRGSNSFSALSSVKEDLTF